jgi:hypothetical protein
VTPRQAAAELDAILADIAATFDRDGDRQYRLEDTESRLAALARQLRTDVSDRAGDDASPMTGALMPGQCLAQMDARRDGPHAEEHTVAAAWLASEAVRYLNYATGSHAPAGLPYPATVYSVTGALGEAASRLPQLCSQLAAWLDAERRAGQLADDHGGPVAPLTDRARFHLDQAAMYAAALGRALDSAQAATATLHATDQGSPQ